MKTTDLYIAALAEENAAFNAIKDAGTDAQWDSYFDAQEACTEARNLMLDEACAIALGMISDAESRSNVAKFFDIAKCREGDARTKAIAKAMELSKLC